LLINQELYKNYIEYPNKIKYLDILQIS